MPVLTLRYMADFRLHVYICIATAAWDVKELWKWNW